MKAFLPLSSAGEITFFPLFQRIQSMMKKNRLLFFAKLEEQ